MVDEPKVMVPFKSAILSQIPLSFHSWKRPKSASRRYLALFMCSQKSRSVVKQIPEKFFKKWRLGSELCCHRSCQSFEEEREPKNILWSSIWSNKKWKMGQIHSFLAVLESECVLGVKIPNSLTFISPWSLVIRLKQNMCLEGGGAWKKIHVFFVTCQLGFTESVKCHSSLSTSWQSQKLARFQLPLSPSS